LIFGGTLSGLFFRFFLSGSNLGSVVLGFFRGLVFGFFLSLFFFFLLSG
jgi:hypothetical protein